MTNHPGKIILIKGKAGLGNRLLSAATGLLYGRLTGRKVYVDWSDETYSDHGENAFSSFFQVEGLHTRLPDLHGCSVAPAVWDGHLDESASVRVETVSPGQHGSKSLQRFSIDIRRRDYPQDVLVLCRYMHGLRSLSRHFSGEYACLNRLSTEQLLSELLSEFVCAAPVRDAVEDFARQHFHRPTIGVHIRHMDRSCGLQPFLRHLDALRKRMPTSIVFLATDDNELNTILRDRYSACMTDKWYPTAGNSLHQNKECLDRRQNGIEALIDLYLLARCGYLIYPGSSTFSWVARMFSTNPEARFYDIERYQPRARIRQWIRNWLYS